MNEKPTIRQNIKWLKTLPKTPERDETILTLQTFIKHMNTEKKDIIIVTMNPKRWKQYRERVLMNGG
jgi:hypothetical protein